jgi:integrase
MVPAIEMLPETNRRKGFFEQEEYEAVLARLPDQLKGVLTVGYWTGMRKEEIQGLKWDQIDLFNRLAYRERTKNGEDRTLPLNDELSAVFERQAAARWHACAYVFYRGPECIHDFRNAWAAATKAAGCPGRLFHDLRRTGVRNLIRAGMAQSVAMLISCRKDARMLARYNIADARDVQYAMQKVSAYEARKREDRRLRLEVE